MDRLNLCLAWGRKDLEALLHLSLLQLLHDRAVKNAGCIEVNLDLTQSVCYLDKLSEGVELDR